MNNQAPSPLSLDKLRARRLRIIGVVVVLVGLATARFVYWRGTQAPDLSNDSSMAGFDRAARRQSGELFGTFGQMTEDLSNALQQPGTQSAIIALVSAGIAVGCFYLARLLETE